MLVTVSTVDHTLGASISVATGVDSDGRQVTFAGDWRPMRDLAEYVKQDGPVVAQVESWQVLSIVDIDERVVQAEPDPDQPSMFEVVAETGVDRG